MNGYRYPKLEDRQEVSDYIYGKLIIDTLLANSSA